MILIIIVLCVLCLEVGAAVVLLCCRSRKIKPKNGKRKPLRTMDLILIIIGVLLVVFTIYMIALFREYGAIPDTLVTCVFATLAGECGIMGWIKTTKDRRQERKWEIEDRSEMNGLDSENEEE